MAFLLLQKKFERLAVVDEIAQSAWTGPERTQNRLAVETIRKYHTTAWPFWETAISRFSGSVASTNDVPEEDDLAEWLDSDACKHEIRYDRPAVSRWGDVQLELYRCSSCGSASAVLRKCARCGETRYCDQVWCVLHESPDL